MSSKNFRNQPSQNPTRRTPYTNPPYKQSTATTSVALPQPFSEADEQKAIPYANGLYFALVEYLTPALRYFLYRRRLLSPSSTNYDCADLLYRIIDETNQNANFLSAPISTRHLYKAVQGRNLVCHISLPEIFKEWEEILRCWTRVCEAMADTAAADNIRTVRLRLVRQEYRRAVDGRAMRLHIRAYNEGDAFGIGEMLYYCILKYMAPSIRKFLELKNPSIAFSLDLYENLKDIIAKQKQNADYLADAGTTRNDERTLKMSMKARNQCCHGFFADMFYNWESYLASWIELLNVIGAIEAKEKLQSMYNTLIDRKNKGRSIRSAVFL
ncbi:hypothetical protein GHT06_012864 [Daphnia sinensis]|uniref:Uncharacterized protein n=1 Tax=Daphnia sinensis TaxID=1820382 RepID=A0AAD5PWJ4_9CRUS|nr:hypothetical protein GHT06_012864 [Daphnia sinensis]